MNFEIPGEKDLIQKFVRPPPEKCQIAMQQPEAPVGNQAENVHSVNFLTAGYTRWGHKRNEDVLRELQLESVIHFINNYQLNWQNHVHCMSVNRIPNAMLHYRPLGKRSLGRPNKRWIENVALRP